MAILEPGLVGIVVLASALFACRSLAPFRFRVALARRLSGRVPDRVVIWIAGATACQNCGGRAAAWPAGKPGGRP